MHKYMKITAYPFIYLVQFLAMWSSPRIYACSALRTHLSRNIASTGLKMPVARLHHVVLTFPNVSTPKGNTKK